MSTRRYRKSTRKTEINMVPFLDVLLTVLLIFMIATPAVNRSIDVNVPHSAASSVTEESQEKDILVVEVHSDATFTLLFNVDKYTDLDANQLKLQMNRLLENVQADNLIVQVAADRTALYNNVVDAITLIKQYGIQDVGLITKGSGDNAEAPAGN